MKNTSFRARTVACALLASTAYCGLTAAPASAQTMSDPERQAPDENGVDVISGKVSVPVRSITAGRAGEGGLSYANGWAAGEYFDTFKVEVGGLQGAVTTITIYGTDRRFTDNGNGTWTNADGDGATFAYDAGIDGYVYTARDGTVFRFLKSLGDTGFAPIVTARISTITRPDGEVISYHHRIQPGSNKCTTFEGCVTVQGGGRVQSVTSNLGHQLKASYASNTWNTDGSGNENFFKLNRVTAINNAADYCAPGADACTGLTQSWPELAIGESVSGSTVTRTFTDRLNQTTRVTTGPGGVTSLTSPADASADLTIGYDANNRVATYARAGGSWGYSYADSGSTRTTTVTQPLGGSKVYVSDLNLKRVLSVADELGRTTSFQYDGLGRLTRTTAAEGDYVQYTYDARGNVTQTSAVAKPGSGLSNINASAAFEAGCSNPRTCNQPISTTDARGFTTDYSYDPGHGGLLTATAPAPTAGAVRPQVRYGYNALSAYYKNSAGTIVAAPSPVYRLTAVSTCQTQSSCAGTADEVKTTIAYGSAGTANNLLATSVSSGAGNGSLTATTAQTHDVFGNVVTVDGPLAGSGDTVRYRYDAERQLVGAVSPDPDGAGPLKHRAVRTTFNGDGQASRIENGIVNGQSDADWAGFSSLEAAEIGYDAFGRAVTQKLVAGGTTHALVQQSYDAKGRLSCTAQRMNPAEFASLPADACTQDNAGGFGPDRISRTVYNNADEATQVQTGVGTGDLANEASATYTANGQTQTLTDGENNKTTYEYDGHDRLARTIYPSPTKGAGTSNYGDYEQPGYDQGSNVTSFRNRAGETISFSYDNLNRVTFKNLPGAEPDVSYAYDLLGRPTSVSQPGHTLSFGYDALGRRVSESGPHGTVGSQYDLAGRRTRLQHPDGFFVNQDYLVTGEMTQIHQPGGDIFSPPIVLASFGYDDLGRRTSLNRANGTTTSYSYDPVSRLSQLVQNPAGTSHDLTLGFSYNPASQITQNTRSNDTYAWTGHGSGTSNSPANGLNQLTSIAGGGISHDAKGNITYDPIAANSYGYSSENLLTSVSGANWSNVLGYDPAMRLYQTGSVRNGYDGDERIAEYNSSGTQTARYIHGPGVDEPLVSYSGAGLATRSFLHADERGTIIARSDDAGNVVSLGRFDEYGKHQSLASRFGFAGMPMETLTYLHYSRARMYNQRMPRFMQPDPIGYDDGMNMYNRTGGDPVNFTDPTGLAKGCPPRQPSSYYCGRTIKPSRSVTPGAGGSLGNPVVRGGSLPATRNLRSVGAGGGRQAPKRNARMKPSTKKYLCGKLAANGFNVPKTYRDVLSDRHGRTNGISNWNVTEFRQSENFLYATGQWRFPPTEGSTYLGVYAHQFSKYIRSETSEFSWDALNAGLDGVDHKNDSPEDMKEFCNAR